MKQVKLGDLVSIVGGGTPSKKNPEFWNGSIPWATVKDLKSKTLSQTLESITKEGLENSAANLIRKGTVVTATRMGLGRVAITSIEVAINQDLKALYCKKELAPQYLLRFIEYKANYLERLGKGATVKGIQLSELNKLKIPIPEKYEDQIRIATLLSRAEALIAKRKESLHLLDDLLKSTFLEMFGDPQTNEKKWEKQKISEIIIKIQAGTSYGGKEKSTLEGDELGVLKISAITSGYLDLNEVKAVNKKEIKKDIITLKKGMFLFSRANTKELVAACCIVHEDYPKLFLPDKLWSIDFESSIVNLNFMDFLFKNESFRNILRKKATGGHQSMLNISMKKLVDTFAPIPPLRLQNEFSQIVEKVESIKSIYKASLQQLENLYGSLSQRAFKGELDLSRVPAIVEPHVSEEITNTDAKFPENRFFDLSNPDFNRFIKSTQIIENELNKAKEPFTAIQKVQKEMNQVSELFGKYETEFGKVQRILSSQMNQLNKSVSSVSKIFQSNQTLATQGNQVKTLFENIATVNQTMKSNLIRESMQKLSESKSRELDEKKLCDLIKKEFKNLTFTAGDILERTYLEYEYTPESTGYIKGVDGEKKGLKDLLLESLTPSGSRYIKMEQVYELAPNQSEFKVQLRVVS